MNQKMDTENQRVDSLLNRRHPRVDVADSDAELLTTLRSSWADLEPIPVLLHDRSEGIDHSWGDVDVRTLLRGEDSAGRYSAHSVVLGPGAGLDPHYFEDTSSYILVTEGLVDLQIGRDVSSAGQHSLGFAPPATRQAFRNNTGAAATVILVYTPAGVDRGFEALHQASAGDGEDLDQRAILSRYGFRFDDAELANDSLTNDALPDLEFEFKGPGDLERLRQAFEMRPVVPKLVITTPDEFDATTASASRRKELIGGDDTGGQAMLNMLSGLPGFGAPAHHQPTEDEFFFITGGELKMTCASTDAVLKPTAMAFCPKNCTHGFENLGPAESRFVTLNSPGGHERAMAAVRAAAGAGATKEELWELSVAGGFVFHSVDDLG